MSFPARSSPCRNPQFVWCRNLRLNDEVHYTDIGDIWLGTVVFFHDFERVDADVCESPTVRAVLPALRESVTFSIHRDTNLVGLETSSYPLFQRGRLLTQSSQSYSSTNVNSWIVKMFYYPWWILTDYRNCLRLQVVPLSLGPSCVTQKKTTE